MWKSQLAPYGCDFSIRSISGFNQGGYPHSGVTETYITPRGGSSRGPVWGDPNELLDDDGVSPLPNSYHRLREGVERFFITDINNPAASSASQSQIFVMFDAYGDSGTWAWDAAPSDQGILRFNHVPGGSNVLYMDGHVGFVRLKEKAPLALGPFVSGNYGNMTRWLIGGAGGIG